MQNFDVNTEIQNELDVTENKLEKSEKKINRLASLKNWLGFSAAICIGTALGIGVAVGFFTPVIVCGAIGFPLLGGSIIVEIACRKQEKISASLQETCEQLKTQYIKHFEQLLYSKETKHSPKKYKIKKVIKATKEDTFEDSNTSVRRYNKSDETVGNNKTREN